MLLISTTYSKDNIYKYYLSFNLQILPNLDALAGSPGVRGRVIQPASPFKSRYCHDQSCVWKDVDGHQVTWLAIVVESCWI